MSYWKDKIAWEVVGAILGACGVLVLALVLALVNTAVASVFTPFALFLTVPASVVAFALAVGFLANLP